MEQNLLNTISIGDLDNESILLIKTGLKTNKSLFSQKFNVTYRGQHLKINLTQIGNIDCQNCTNPNYIAELILNIDGKDVSASLLALYDGMCEYS